MPGHDLKRGYILGLLAFGMWGFFPLYFTLLKHIPALEIIVQRIVWSAVLGSLLLLVWKHRNWWQDLRAHPRRFGVLAISGLLVTANWTIYVWAVNNEHMLEASLGYYINPLVNVLLGLILLKERLRRLQWLAVLLATVGVAQQIWHLGQFPWVAFSLALTFGVYGLIRKQAPVAALPGLVVETWFMVPAALIWLFCFADGPTTQWAFWTTPQAILVIMAGPVTLIPLICFNAAARRLPYATLGFMQYLTPTLVLIQAVFLFGETLDAQRLYAFIFIWVALLIYSIDSLILLRKWSGGRSSIINSSAQSRRLQQIR